MSLPLIARGGQLLLGLTKSLPTVAGVGVVGTGITSGVGRALDLFPDDASIAEERGYDLNNNKVEKTNRVGNFLRDVITGTDNNEINRIAKENAIQQVNDNTSSLRGQILQRSNQLDGGLTEEGLKRQPGETEQELRDRLNLDAETLSNIDFAKSHDIEYIPGSSRSSLEASVKRRDAAKPTSPENRYINTLERQLRNDQYQADLLAYNERMANARFAFQTEQADLNRKDNLQMKMLDQGMQREELRAADRRADRRDRNQLILQIIDICRAPAGALQISKNNNLDPSSYEANLENYHH